MTVAICEYGAGNVRSVELAFARLGVPRVDDLESAALAVLPGVGSARSALAGLRTTGADSVLRARVEAGRPVLGICLGLQLGLDWTEEDSGVDALGLVEGRAERLRTGRVPRIGWAQVDGGDAYYFAHSYAAVTPHGTAWSDGIVAEVRAGSFVGCQFHPEKSGPAGLRYLESVLRRARSCTPA